MKKIKHLFRILIFILVCILVFYGVGKLETFDKEREEAPRFEKIIHQNSDVYAWIKVEGTRINYPVAQHPTDDTYYLSHDLEHNNTYYGAIFTEKTNTKTLEDLITIIYGHAITDGAMFGSLDYFANHQFFDSHSNIVIDTLDKHYEYEIIAAHSYNDDHLFYTFHLAYRDGVISYISSLRERALEYGGFFRQISTDFQKDRFLILSTCDSTNDNQRFVVTAKLKTVTERIGK